MTQKALPDACECSVDTIRALEAGRRMYGPASQRVADFLGVEIDRLWASAIAPGTVHPRQRQAFGLEHEPQPAEAAAHDDGPLWEYVRRHRPDLVPEEVSA
jgi:hypothetical protein